LPGPLNHALGVPFSFLFRYALGIMMWEMVSAVPIYATLADRDIAYKVVHKHLRPEFPAHIDCNYSALAQQCWAADPGQRPTIKQVVGALGGMVMSLRQRIQKAAAARASAASANSNKPVYAPPPPPPPAHMPAAGRAC
jgi:hypothetical protein